MLSEEKTHDEQLRAAPEETAPEEREHEGSTRLKTGRSLRTCLSRGVPADHEARSQVKVKEKSSCRSEGAQSKLDPKERLYSKFQERGDASVQCKKGASE